METAKVFWNGRSQAVRLPKEFRFEGSEVLIQRVGNGVLLMPCQDPWNALEESLDRFSDAFMVSRNQPEQQVREDPFG